MMNSIYSYCETVTSSGASPWHIRQLTEAGRKLGGGADTPALCGRVVAWDLLSPVRRLDVHRICEKCFAKWEKTSG